jgi:hypothetical protein
MVEVQVVILPFNFQNKKKNKIKKVEKREKRK